MFNSLKNWKSQIKLHECFTLPRDIHMLFYWNWSDRHSIVLFFEVFVQKHVSANLLKAFNYATHNSILVYEMPTTSFVKFTKHHKILVTAVGHLKWKKLVLTLFSRDILEVPFGIVFDCMKYFRKIESQLYLVSRSWWWVAFVVFELVANTNRFQRKFCPFYWMHYWPFGLIHK